MTAILRTCFSNRGGIDAFLIAAFVMQKKGFHAGIYSQKEFFEPIRKILGDSLTLCLSQDWIWKSSADCRRYGIGSFRLS
jgi:hypothetical protein